MIIILIAITLPQLSWSVNKCHDAYSCAYTSITGSGVTECYGDHSCFESPNIEYRADNTASYCGGSFSCYGATLITQIDITSFYGYLYCGGLFSCAYVDEILPQGGLACEGEKSCVGSTVVTANLVFCNGDHSCINATINSTNANGILVRGHLGAQNAIFNTPGESSTISYQLQGMDSGRNASIYCFEYYTCTII